MSERGTWITEFIYCEQCRDAVRAWLVKTGATELPPSKEWSGGEITPGVFAGRIGGLYSGEELDMMDGYLLAELTGRVCHPLRLAVLADEGDRTFRATPVGA